MRSRFQRLARLFQDLVLLRQTGEREPLLVVPCGGEFVLHRPLAPLDEQTPALANDESVEVDHCRWRPITSVRRLLSPLHAQLCDMVQMRAWTRVLYLHSVASACTFLARVAASLGVRLQSSVDLERLRGDDLRDQCVLTQRRAGAVRQLVESTMAAMAQSLTDPVQPAQQDGILKLQLEHGQVHAIWLTESGTVVSREPLLMLVDRVARRQVEAFLERLEVWSARLQQCHRYIEQALEDACPEIAQSVLREPLGRRAGYRLFSGSAQGFPAEGFLYLEPPQADFQGRATVLCNRAHAEFILQNAATSSFWFPPCALSCRVPFQQGDQAFLRCWPEVRIPQGFLPMVHPYVGNMQPDNFASFEILNSGNCAPAMLPVSADFPRLGITPRERISVPVARDLCIPLQDIRIRTILGEAKDAWGETQPYPLVEGIWQLAIQGLTRAHEGNRDTPRARLDGSSMLYPISNSHGIAGTSLAARVFRYQP